jgi:two-component system cell cycle response regulator DivK
MGKTILVVEDNELNLRLFCDLLNAHGYSAHPVRDGRDALAKAREVAPDLIIMDIQLPHVSGLELIGQMKADPALKPVPIMAVTAYAGKGDEEQIRAAGAEAYVSKPFSVIKFIVSVGAFACGAKTTVRVRKRPVGDILYRHPGLDPGPAFLSSQHR